MFQQKWLLSVGLILGVGFFPRLAPATVVWKGKEVPAWPDLQPQVDESTAFAMLGPIHLFPHPTGVVKGLAILVDFSDVPATLTKEEVDAWLNTKGYNKYGLTGSIRDYYLGQSNNIVDYQNEVHGYYRAKKTRAYDDGGTSYARADELWSEVIAAMDAEIDFSLFDNDKDGKTEAISLLYAGGEGTFAQGLWPHASGSGDKKDGVTLNRYMMTALHTQPTNYVFAHESGHMLFGWPDLYGVGDYCIMANRDSDTNPVGINDMFRVDQGWLDVVDIDSSTNATYTTAPDAPAYRYVNSAKTSEYFLWSNVQPAKEWVSLKGGGILLWHFDNSIRDNTPPATLQLAVVQGGGTRILSATTWPSPGTAATDFFYKGNNSEFGAATKPASTWNNNSASGLRIYDISANGPQMTFSVGTGPIVPTGGATSTGGASAVGGTKATGGSVAAGGTQSTGGQAATGGKSSSSSGGTSATAGAVSSGGAFTTGGRSVTAAGGSLATGGKLSSGGTTSTSGGTNANGQTTGGSATAGNTTGGNATSVGGNNPSSGGAAAVGGSSSAPVVGGGSSPLSTSTQSNSGAVSDPNDGSCGCRSVGSERSRGTPFFVGMVALVGALVRRRSAPLDVKRQ